tara:strand:- start:309 stop:515 length:207 start_codon:yes stop_codon:yes gene_type:complete
MALALASGGPWDVRAAIVAGGNLSMVGAGVGGGGGEGRGAGGAGGFGLLITPASCKPATDFIMSMSDS